MFEPKPIKRPREQVENQLREAILGGTFQQGERLPSEIDLSSCFGVSRTTIREALRTLADDGLVNKVPGATGGSFVTAIDHRALGGQIRSSVETILRLGSLTSEELLEVRALLEIPSIGLAARNRIETHIDVLRQLIEETKSLPFDDPAIEEIDTKFHYVIAEASGNRLLSAFVTALHTVAHPAQHLVFTEETRQASIAQHVAILDALESGDSDIASSVMQSHLDYLRELPIRDQPS